ncbi:hypothetical protein Dimus_036906 [Dionaea muscipula]
MSQMRPQTFHPTSINKSRRRDLDEKLPPTVGKKPKKVKKSPGKKESTSQSKESHSPVRISDDRQEDQYMQSEHHDHDAHMDDV